MPDKPHNLAIETSGPSGSCALGRHDKLIAVKDLSHAGPQAAARTSGHGRAVQIDLMVAIDQLTTAHGVDPRSLGEVYLSIGPGSFTGLRVAVATAKAMATVLGVRVVGVSTVEAVAHNTPTDQETEPHLAVCLNHKRNTVFAQLFDRVENRWQERATASVRPIDELLNSAPRPLAVIADPVVAAAAGACKGVRWWTGPDRPSADSQAVWCLGRAMAQRGQYTDPARLLPLYARPPEAQRLWDIKHPPAKTLVSSEAVS